MPRRLNPPDLPNDDAGESPPPADGPGGIPDDLSCAPMGRHLRRLDAARRVHLPVGWRGRAGAGWYLLPWPPGASDHLLALSPGRFRLLAERLQDLVSAADARADMLERLTMSAVVQAGVDRVGRISLPERLLALAGIREEVALVGLIDRFEIWEPRRLDSLMSGSIPAGGLEGLTL